ncbi:hypothetical protein V1514DRAFT_273534, partial [Lipomyces japonicus]|uniref:uncharacterized protein n=1 Tax=Lipomyces japonicus TaxID=56871 RepID=UPI0034CD3303
SVDPRSPAGGVAMVTPALTASKTYIRIGDYATFSWNYTSLIVSPSAVNVEAYCSMNDYYYPIAENLTISHSSAVWDTGNYQGSATVPLLTAEYTLFIYDSSSDPSEIASAGHLGPFDSLRFGVYSPQAYTPLNDFTCATCSAAISFLDPLVLRGALIMTIVSTVS